MLPLCLNLPSAALLRLKDKNGKCATESQFVKTACLPTEDFPDGTVCSISGWGATTECKRENLHDSEKYSRRINTFKKGHKIGLTVKIIKSTVSHSLLFSTAWI